MKTAPVFHFEDLRSQEQVEQDHLGFQKSTRIHPHFGTWVERSLDLGHIRVFEHKVDFNRRMDVHFSDKTLNKYVHHCMSVEGQIDANFLEHKIRAHLPHNSFHNMFLPGSEYFIGMGDKFVNVHLEIDREHYLDLLGDSEDWSVELRNRLLRQQVHYNGEASMTAPMLQTIYSIFNGTLSGSLKKLLIEAKTHELIALQLDGMVRRKKKKENSNKELFVGIREYLEKSFLEPHSLKSISRRFGINEFSLKKGFRENFDTTIFDLLLSLRLLHSQRLLQDTDTSIISIASMVGYKYPNHFSAAFKKKFGVNPGLYRNN